MSTTTTRGKDEKEICTYAAGNNIASVTSAAANPVARSFLEASTNWFAYVLAQRPGIQAPILDIRIHEPELLSDGYIFIAPFHAAQSGPYIFDTNGSLVWSGFGVAGPANVYNFHVCSYRGADHLCFHAGTQTRTYSKGHGVVMDGQYRVVKTVHAAAEGLPSDLHEFRLNDNGETALMTIYQPRQLDLRKYGVTSGLGWVLDSMFQEVNITSGELLFEWRSLDHVPPEMGYHALNISEEGQTSETAWDYFHINSVDKGHEGDYLISARHTNCIYKISSQTGSILWELNGKNSTFTMPGFNFSWQHDARWILENETTSVISLFDNSRRSHDEVGNLYSSGKFITLNHVTNIATLDKEMLSPDTSTGQLSTQSQGNMQLLPNSNLFFGWGAEAHISEHLPNGTPVWHAVFGQEQNPNSYRAFKAPWKGDPGLTTPAIWAYGRTNTSRTVVYVSWNGATEVEAWNVYAGESSGSSLQLAALRAPKDGFETTIVLDQHYPWVTVEAVGKDDNPIRNSSVLKTFIPGVLIVFTVTSRYLWANLALRRSNEYMKVEDSQNDFALQGQSQQ
ncbi:ASST-domain-containing protein [Leptodontidium sp. MPI-SDFR-AT-0119]|nr:ASST-domain-containing protein [Leptodontidium sp. MPI-SDFR-AT-0119]